MLALKIWETGHSWLPIVGHDTRHSSIRELTDRWDTKVRHYGRSCRQTNNLFFYIQIRWIVIAIYINSKWWQAAILNSNKLKYFTYVHHGFTGSIQFLNLEFQQTKVFHICSSWIYWFHTISWKIWYATQHCTTKFPINSLFHHNINYDKYVNSR